MLVCHQINTNMSYISNKNLIIHYVRSKYTAQYIADALLKKNIAQVRKIRKPEDIRPGTRKGKIDQKEIWLFKISMPKKLMSDINRGYTELDRNKIEDIVNANSINMSIDPAEQQAQDMANAQQPAA